MYHVLLKKTYDSFNTFKSLEVILTDYALKAISNWWKYSIVKDGQMFDSWKWMMPCLQDIPDDTVPVTAFLKELLGLATAQRPLLIFFDSIDELTGSQVCDNLSDGAPWSCHCFAPPLLKFFDSIDGFTGSQVCDNLSDGDHWSCHCTVPPLTYILRLNRWAYRLSGMWQPVWWSSLVLPLLCAPSS